MQLISLSLGGHALPGGPTRIAALLGALGLAIAGVLAIPAHEGPEATTFVAAFGAALGALLGAGLELARRNAVEMPRLALIVSGLLIAMSVLVAVTDRVARSRDRAFLAEIDSTRGQVSEPHPNDHNTLTVDYSVNGITYRRREGAPGLARDFRPGDSVTVYFRRPDPSQGRFIRPYTTPMPLGALVLVWVLGYAWLLGVGGSFIKAVRPEVASRWRAA